MNKYSTTKTVQVGYGSRIMASIKGIGTGAVLALLAFPVLLWNEGRAVQTAKSLEEGVAAVVSVSTDRVDPGYEGALVHLVGQATSQGTLQDGTFGIAEPNALRLRRVVEMYQWSESKHTETQRNTGGSETRVTTYEYRDVWSDTHIDSRRFNDHERFVNPAVLPYGPYESAAKDVTIGAFVPGERLLDQLRRTEIRPFTDADLDALPGEVREQAQGRTLSLRDGLLYAADNPAAPQIGDFRVRLEVVRPQTVSVVAKQLDQNLVPYQTRAGDALAMLRPGAHAADALFAEAMANNAATTWVVRLIGLLMFFFGFTLIFKPLGVVADVLPLLGSVLRLGTGLVAGALALGLSLVTIAVGWFAYRPVAGSLLLVAGLGLFIVLTVLGARSKAAGGQATAKGSAA